MHVEEDILHLVRDDAWMMAILKAAKLLDLPDWWVCAGFVRSKIWDTIHWYKERTPLSDVDVVYYDPANVKESEEQRYEQMLNSLLPGIPWSVKNQARMHVVNNTPPYSSSADAISKFPETATALGVSLDEQHNLILTAPCGIDDVLKLEVRPTAYVFQNEECAKAYRRRSTQKNFKSKWPMLKVTTI